MSIVDIKLGEDCRRGYRGGVKGHRNGHRRLIIKYEHNGEIYESKLNEGKIKCHEELGAWVRYSPEQAKKRFGINEWCVLGHYSKKPLLYLVQVRQLDDGEFWKGRPLRDSYKDGIENEAKEEYDFYKDQI